jgi:glycosyltransferase involved in cell wall biosynthesis
MISETDAGMYDAINKGLKRGSGRICAYLNCDEQYLPGALVKVKEGFAKHSEAEILYGGFLVVDEQGRLVTAQRPVRMFWPHVATSHLPNFTCATFFLRAMLERDQAWFDSSYRACGDAVWNIQRLKDEVPCQISGEFLSAFIEGGTNQGLGQAALGEADQIRRGTPPWAQAGSLFWKMRHRLLKLFTGRYFGHNVHYRLYLPGVTSGRKEFFLKRANTIWQTRYRL